MWSYQILFPTQSPAKASKKMARKGSRTGKSNDWKRRLGAVIVPLEAEGMHDGYGYGVGGANASLAPFVRLRENPHHQEMDPLSKPQIAQYSEVKISGAR